jgi:glycosyltransferase involved in cell wall biosynthesis
MDKVDPKIALVVCTKNRAKKLDAFLESIRKLNYDQPWEFIIVDGSTDDTSERLKEFAATFAHRVTIITELRSGLGLARNRGWRASSAPIIAFTDDDCYPAPNFLNDVEMVFADPSVGFAGGRILLHDPSDARITIYEHPTEQIYDPEHFIVAGVISGANMAFRRQALVDIAGFDDSLGAGTPFGFEDVDAELRALAAGWTGKYDPRSVVYHHHGRKPGIEVETLSRAYDAARGAYYMKAILFMPHRWRCLRHWLRGIRRQPFGQTAREVQAATRYFFYLFKRKPNVTY